jgi:hypothetical protein
MDQEINLHFSPKFRFRKLSLRGKRSNLAFFDQIATLARPAFAEAASRRQAEHFGVQARLRAGAFGYKYLLQQRQALRRAGTHLLGARNGRMENGFRSLNRILGLRWPPPLQQPR